MAETRLDEAVSAFESGDDATALALFRPLAEKGDARAQYYLGLMYLEDRGVRGDAREALAWFKRAAVSGDPDAQYMLAPCIHYGGSGPNPEEAMAWLRRAAEQGQPEAQRDLGAYLATGEICARDEREALHWYLQAAAQGHPDAQYNAGLMLLEGEGCTPDQAQGRKWLKQAADGGDFVAMEVLAAFCEDGLHGFPRDPQNAIAWYEASIAEGSARAKFCLGMIYLEGRGVAKDVAKGLGLVRESDQEGYLYARDVLTAHDDQ
jgi:TPR repeat protein